MNIFFRILVAITQFFAGVAGTCVVLIPFESWHGCVISDFNAALLSLSLVMFSSMFYFYALIAQFIYDDTI